MKHVLNDYCRWKFYFKVHNSSSWRLILAKLQTQGKSSSVSEKFFYSASWKERKALNFFGFTFIVTIQSFNFQPEVFRKKTSIKVNQKILFHFIKIKPLKFYSKSCQFYRKLLNWFTNSSHKNWQPKKLHLHLTSSLSSEKILVDQLIWP